ncbi:hypothetical protein F511_24358 [Dorcoceras hygrometricum]|uniref:Uncharacterized protein n=1 Tax=Dorcoceras hygrometricum TaxID=472368 RepID=A0A2Z7D8C4_9LAMI|nr:hypothetical protein F511_24358 [Dorcoceras hygrometricum]
MFTPKAAKGCSIRTSIPQILPHRFHKKARQNSRPATSFLLALQFTADTSCDSTQALTTRTKLKTTMDAHPKVHASRRKTRHRFLPKTSNASNSTLPNLALIQGLKWVEIERAKLEEFNATKIIKNRDWKRRESTVESYGEQ